MRHKEVCRSCRNSGFSSHGECPRCHSTDVFTIHYMTRLPANNVSDKRWRTFCDWAGAKSKKERQEQEAVDQGLETLDTASKRGSLSRYLTQHPTHEDVMRALAFRLLEQKRWDEFLELLRHSPNLTSHVRIDPTGYRQIVLPKESLKRLIPSLVRHPAFARNLAAHLFDMASKGSWEQAQELMSDLAPAWRRDLMDVIFQDYFLTHTGESDYQWFLARKSEFSPSKIVPFLTAHLLSVNPTSKNAVAQLRKVFAITGGIPNQELANHWTPAVDRGSLSYHEWLALFAQKPKKE